VKRPTTWPTRLLRQLCPVVLAALLAVAVGALGSLPLRAWGTLLPLAEAVGVVIIVVATAFRPIIGVVVLLLLLTFSTGSAGVSRLEIAEAGIFGVTMVASAVRGFLSRRSAWKHSLLLPSALFFIASIVLSALPAYGSGVEMSFWARRAFPFFLVMTFPIVHDACDRNEHMLRFLVALLLVLGFARNVPILAHWYANAAALRGLSNLQALRLSGSGVWLMSFPVLAGAAAAASRSPWMRRALVVSVVVSLGALVLSYTRSYYLGAGIALAVTVVLGCVTDRGAVLRVAGEALGMSVASLMALFAMAGEATRKLALWFVGRLSSILSGAGTTSVQDRFAEIHYLSTLVPHSPIIGYGLGAAYSFYSPTPFSWNLPIGYKTIFYSHNFYAYHLYATGLIGLVALILFLGDVVVRAARAARHTSGRFERLLLCAIVGQIAGMSFSSLTSSEFSEKLPNLVLGICVGLASYLVDRVRAARLRDHSA
jgi:hypothetical protein